MSKSLFAPESQSGDFSILEAGQYPARCYAVVDIGTRDTEWQGVSKKKRELVIMFEFPTELTQFKKDGPKEPFVLSKYLTLSLSDQGKMKPFVEAWLGKKIDATFDLFSLVGQTAFISVSHEQGKNGKTYANIGTIMPLPKLIECPPMVCNPIIYSVKDHDDAMFDLLYPKLQEKINESDERSFGKTTAAPSTASHEPPPFA